MKKIVFFIIFLLIGLFAGAGARADSLDVRYGILSLPLHIKYYEVDDRDNIMLNPYLQVATKRRKALLDKTCPVYDWVIDAQGNLRVISVVPHPRGRTYPGRYTRPEDGYSRAQGYVEHYGHVSALAGAPGRIGGEIVNDYKNKNWIINNKSGRYSRGNPDRFPRQLANAAALIRSVTDPGGQGWGPVAYLLDYAPPQFRSQELANPLLRFGKPESKRLPYFLLDLTGENYGNLSGN